MNGYCLQFPYAPEFIEALKEHIPSGFRTYDPTTKIWAVAETECSTVLELMQGMGWRPEIVTREEVEKESPFRGDVPLEQVALAFMKLIPREVMSKAYKQAVLLLHPDRGGDGVRMTELNAAWTRLQEVYE